MTRRTITAATIDQATKSFKSVIWPWVCEQISAGRAIEIVAQLRKITGGQNRFMHQLFGIISKSGFEWAGKKRSPEEVKVLMVSAHMVATQLDCEVVIGLEGELVQVRESTANMRTKRAASLLEYVIAYCAENDIKIPHSEDEYYAEWSQNADD